jgi:hypothetical protein
MEIKNLIDHCTFILGETPHKNELIIPVKLVLKPKQTAIGKRNKLKARVVARGDLEKRCIKKTKAAHQQHVLQLRQDIAEGSPSSKPNIQPVDIPQPSEDTWSPCASPRGVLLILLCFKQKQRQLPFRSAVCTLLYLAYNTWDDILFAVCKLERACISPGIVDFQALSWLIG